MVLDEKARAFVQNLTNKKVRASWAYDQNYGLRLVKSVIAQILIGQGAKRMNWRTGKGHSRAASVD